MVVEPTRPRFSGDIVMDERMDVLTHSGGSAEDQQMQAANTQGIVAIQSVGQRTEIALDTTKVLANQMLECMAGITETGKHLTAGGDPTLQLDVNMQHFAQDLQAAVGDTFLKTAYAAQRRMVQLAGSDVRTAIRPPQPQPPPTVIVQQTVPKLEPAPFFTKKQKYVFSDR